MCEELVREVGKIVAYISNNCDVAPYNEARRRFPAMNGRTLPKVDRRAFLLSMEPLMETVDPFFQSDLIRALEHIGSLQGTQQSEFFELFSMTITTMNDERDAVRRFILAFYLKYVKRVHRMSKDVMEIVWGVCCTYWADDPITDGDFCSILFIQDFLFWILVNYDLQDILFKWMDAFVSDKKLSSFYNFFGLMIRLYSVHNFDVVLHMRKSTLYRKLFDLAKTDLPVFNLLQHLMCDGHGLDDDCFCQKFSLDAIEHFFDPKRQDAVVHCFNLGIVTSDVAKAYLSTAILAILRKSRETKRDAGYLLFVTIISCFSRLPADLLLPTSTNESIFDAMAELTTEFPDRFYETIESVTDMCLANPSIPDLINEYDQNFFKILARIEPQEDIRLDVMFSFICCCRTTSCQTRSVIRNARAIVLCLELARNAERETTVVNWLMNLTYSSANVYEMHRGGLPLKIVERLPEIQTNATLRRLYVDLYQAVSATMFSNVLFCRTIGMMKEPTYEHPTEILQVFNRLLETEFDTNEPVSFFRFDGIQGCGFHCSELQVTTNFTIIATVRLLRDTGTNFDTLMACDANQDIYMVGITDNRLCLRISTGRTVVEQKCTDSPLDTGTWYHVAVMVHRFSQSYSRLEVNLNGKTIGQVKVRVSKAKDRSQNTNIGFHVACPDQDPMKRNLQCDMSTIFFLSSVGAVDIPYVPRDVTKPLPESLQSVLICSFSPLRVQKNKIYGVSASTQPVALVGRVVPHLQTMREVLPSIGAVKNLLPLIQRLSLSCPACHESETVKQGSSICTVCGAMSVTVGSEYLDTLFDLLVNLARVDETVFKSRNFFAVLATLIGDVPEPFIGPMKFFDNLSRLFEALKSPGLQTDFVKTFWFNFSIIRNWGIEAKLIYVSMLALALEGHHDAFDFPVGPTILSALTHVRGEGELIKVVDKLLMRCIDVHLHEEDVDTILVIAASTDDDGVRSRCMQYLKFIVDKEPSVFAKYDYFEPFLLFLRGNCQLDALMIIDKLLADPNMIRNLTATSYKMVVLLRPEFIIDADGARNIIDEWFISAKSRMLRHSGRFLSLTAHLYEIQKGECAADFITNSYTDAVSHLPEAVADLYDQRFWMHWMLKLLIAGFGERKITELTSYLQPVLNIKFVEDDVRITALDDLFHYFDLYQSQKDVDMGPAKEQILLLMLSGSTIKEGSIAYQRLLIITFTVVMFKVSFSRTNGVVEVPAIIEEAFDVMNTKVEVKQELVLEERDYMGLVRPLINGLMACDNYLEVAPGIREHGRVIAAFFVAQVMPGNEPVFNSFVKSLATTVKTASAEVRSKCVQIISESIDQHSINCPFASQLQELSADCQESWPIRLTTFALNTAEVSVRAQTEFDQFQLSFCEHFAETVHLDQCHPQTLLEKRLAKTLVLDVQALAREQREDFEAREVANQKTVELFMRELQTAAGPWSKSMKDMHFKACNRISKRGRRVLMVPNHKFSQHEDAVFKRENGQAPKTRKDVILKYNPVKRLPHQNKRGVIYTISAHNVSIKSRHEGVLMVKRSKDKECDGIEFLCKKKSIFMAFPVISFLMNRRFRNEETGIEVYLKTGVSHVFELERGKRVNLYSKLSDMRLPRTERNLPGKFNFFASLQMLCGGLCQTVPSEKLVRLMQLPERWKRCQIPTYEYLYYLNILGGRSFNDCSQYPIYPWLIRENTNREIDLSDDEIYRDLSKPPSALSESRLQVAIEKWHDLHGDPDQCLWREMVSSSAGVYIYMLRTEPFTTLNVKMQSGQFDLANRLFHSIDQVFKDMYNENGNPRECIPEYYSMPQVLRNENHFDLGLRSDGVRVGDIVLPEWAESAFHYVSVVRCALDSPPVGQRIAGWIDLVFGPYRSSFEHHNVYNAFAYPEKGILGDAQTQQFGSMPGRLFDEEHPTRDKPMITEVNWTVTTDARAEPGRTIMGLVKGVLFRRDKMNGSVRDVIVSVDANGITEKLIPFSGYGELFGVSRALKWAVFGTRRDSLLTIIDLQTGEIKPPIQGSSFITSACVTGGEYVITGNNDSSVHVYRMPEMEHVSSSTNQSSSIIAVGGNADLGLMVVIDENFNMVVETMLDCRLINVVSCPPDSVIPLIAIFKSGTIIVAELSRLLVYDSRGIELRKIDTELIISIDKYYDYDEREFLIVSFDRCKVKIYDVATMHTIASYTTQSIAHPHICAIKGSRSFIVAGNEHRIMLFSFADKISSVVTKHERVESQDTVHSHIAERDTKAFLLRQKVIPS